QGERGGAGGRQKGSSSHTYMVADVRNRGYAEYTELGIRRIPASAASYTISDRMNRLARRFSLAGSAITLVLALGTAGFVLVEHWNVFDAFYMSLITLTTVGYAEVHPLSHAGRILNSFLIALGVTAIFVAIGAMTQTIVEMEIAERLSQRRKKRMIDQLKD